FCELKEGLTLLAENGRGKSRERIPELGLSILQQSMLLLQVLALGFKRGLSLAPGFLFSPQALPQRPDLPLILSLLLAERGSCRLGRGRASRSPCPGHQTTRHQPRHEHCHIGHNSVPPSPSSLLSTASVPSGISTARLKSLLRAPGRWARSHNV